MLLLLLACTTPSAPPTAERIVVRAAEVPWRACSDAMPPGCHMAVLEGDPTAETLFTVRLRMVEPFHLPPHTHPRPERVTVLEGAVHVGFGSTVDKAAGERFEAGDYYVNPPEVPHFVWSDEPVTIQVTGIGPWVVTPVH